MLKTLVSFLIIACLPGAAWRTARATQAGALSPTDAQIKLRGVDGKMYDISKMKGSVLLVSFGATWCGPCTTELRALEELQNEYRDKPVRFLWVSLDRREELTDGGLREFVRENNLSFPVLRDPTQLTFAQFSTRVRLPYVIFFDKEGRLATTRHVGMARPEIYKKIVRDNLDRLLMTAANSSATRPRRVLRGYGN